MPLKTKKQSKRRVPDASSSEFLRARMGIIRVSNCKNMTEIMVDMMGKEVI